VNIVEYSINHIAILALVFIALYLLQSQFKLKLISNFASNLVSRGLFYRKETEQGDELLINLIRIIIGCFLLYRLGAITEFALPLEPNSKTIIALVLYWLLLTSFTLGFLAPISALLLLLYQLHFNFVLKTYTLGVDVTAMLLVCMILYPIGRRLSVNALLAKKSQKIQSLYRWFSYEDRQTQIVTAKAIAFYSYCLLCLYSVLMHLDEPLWLNGEAAIHLLGSSYLSKYYAEFQSLFTNSSIAVWVAKISMIGMVIWYFILGPAVLIGGLLRKLVIFWAIAFFLLSTLILQLSVLGYFEFLILTIWFWTNLIPSKIKTINMLYDDRCNLCDRTVRFLKAIDLVNVITFRPISQNQDKAKMIGVAPEDLRNDLYSWEDGDNKVYKGYDFYLHISRRLLLLKVLFPILVLFKWLKIGPWVYKYISRRRIRLFGVCKLPIHSNPQASSHLLINDRVREQKGFYKPFLYTLLIFSVIFLTIMPIHPWAKTINSEYSKLIRSAHILSWSRINVFNAEDLKMTHHYYTVYALSNNSKVQLPFTNIDGSRSHWHQSDRVYFGNSLRWRRSKNSRPILPASKRDKKLFCEIMRWSQNKGFDYHSGISFEFYQSEWPTFVDNKIQYHPRKKVGELLMKADECGLSQLEHKS